MPDAAVAGFDAALYFVYTLASVTGLILVKRYLPAMTQVVQEGGIFRKEVGLAVLGAVLYITSFLIWLIILSRIELSMAYPIAIGLTLVFSTVAAAALLHEQITPTRLVGIGVVFMGILLITRP